MNFSICLIAKNEANSLPHLFNSLKEFKSRGGEIVLVDTGSTDNTVQVAKDFGCKVCEVGDKFYHKYNDEDVDQINKHFLKENEPPILKKGDGFFNFSAARNYAASQASNNMVSMPDCDEEFTKLDLDYVNDIINQGYEQLEFVFVFAHDAFGNESVKFLQCKFYDRRKMTWTGIIHEVLQGEAKRIALDESKFKIEHWQNEQSNRSGYLKGLAYDCFMHPENDRNSHYFGRELLWSGRSHSAIAELKRHVEMNRWPAEAAQSMIHIGDAYGNIGNEKEQIEWYQRSFNHDGTRREPLMKLAWLYYRKGDKLKTAAYCSAALEIPWHGFYGNYMGHYTHEPHELLYWALWWLGDKERSTYHFDKALEYQPNNPKYIHDKQFYHPESYEYKDSGIGGWMSLIELNWLYETSKKVKSVLEIGSWKGRSTHALVSGCTEGTVTCVDTFEGSDDPNDLTYKQGTPLKIYDQFMKNVGWATNLEVLRMTSKEAKEKLGSRQFDMIFIDANHTYEGIKEDIELWKNNARIVLCGHDYSPNWPGVRQAVDEAFNKIGLAGSIWYTTDTNPDEIPKNIFTIWLGDNPPEMVKKCMESQKIPGYSHKLITLENCPKNIPYVNTAIAAKKWVKASDYLRMWYLYNYGGIYLDADMEVLPGKNFDDILKNKFFIGKEENGFIGNSCIGSVPGNPILKKLLTEVDSRFKGDDDYIFQASQEILTPLVFEASVRGEALVLTPQMFFPYNHQTGEIKIKEYTKTFHHFMKTWLDSSDLLPKVSIILPTLGRPEGLKRCLDSINRLYYPKHLIETIILDGPETVPMKVDIGLKQSQGEWIVYAANDMEFTPPSLYEAILYSKRMKFHLVAFNSGVVLPDRGNICEHFMIHKDLIDKIGGVIFDLDFNHVGVDNLLWAKAERLGECGRSSAEVIHHHFSTDYNVAYDEVYQKGWNSAAEDRKLLIQKLQELDGVRTSTA